MSCRRSSGWNWAVAVGCLASLCVASARAADGEFAPEAIQFFEARVRPVLVEHCHSCHSGEAKKLRANLFLDSRANILKGGDTGGAIVPGDPEKSLFIESITYKNVDLQMPPKNKLSDRQIADLTQWVKMGAPWPKEAAKAGSVEAFDLEKRKREAWAFQPIKPRQVPAVKDAAWVKTPIDAFIAAKLDAKNIKPSAQADPRALIRRVYFDLTGLPPTAEQVEAFVAATRQEAQALQQTSGSGKSEIPNPKSEISPAYVKVVDSLLASPHFGEKWARHWLDLVRFAETCGHEFDYPLPHAWRYRDYVIRAFNDDVPYDRFTVEHIAGDLLKNPRLHPSDQTNESIVATGFWHLHEAVHAPVDVRLDEAIRVDNQIDVFSKTFLGLTVACARCHDHKFDPISTKDFYALAGFLQSSRRQEALLDPQHRIANGVKALETEKAKAQHALLAALPGDAKAIEAEVARYLLAVRELHTTDIKAASQASSAQNSRDILFEDFESGTYRNWTITGTAFGDKPQTQQTIGNYQGDVGAKGKWFVNSHNIRKIGNDVGKGDAHTGTLTSKTFTIERDHVTFLIGGGAHKDQTCVNLLVDGKVVRTATGGNDNRMSPASFDVRDLKGKKAQLQIVDNHAGGWGNIGFDHVVFTNDPAGDGKQVVTLPIAEVARLRGLDADRLSRWVDALTSEEAKHPSHPLHVWQRVMKLKSNDPAAITRTLTAITQAREQSLAKAQETSQKSTLFADFNGRDFGDWFVTGDAFGAGPTQPGQWDAISDSPRLVEPGVAHSGAISPRLRGALRSPTFTITSPTIHYRIKGQGTQIRLIIDGYVMDVYNGLLFGDISFRIDTKGQWVWRTQSGDLRKYIGHKAYIEILDDGDGYIAVDEIRFGGNGGEAASSHAIEALTANPAAASFDTLAKTYGSLFAHSVQAWREGKLTGELAPFTQAAVSHQLLLSADDATEQRKAIGEVKKRMAQISATIPEPVRVQALAEGTGEDEFVFIRGSHKNLGDEVPRRLIEAIAPKQEAITQGSGRLELAQRVVDPGNPFISRVIVNRLWHHLFGRGIVPTVDDFGYMGLPPSHPELLDWLATDFMKQGWSIKRTLRQMVLSNVYQQSSRIEPGDARQQADPTNELLHRFPIRRLQAEAIRDAILTVSGRLDRTVGGPSVPVHLTPFMEGRGRPGSGPLDGNGRRSLYTEIRRNFLPPMLLAFDFPSPFSTMGRRTVSNVPAQALILMNDPLVIEQAGRWAQREVNAGGDAGMRIDRMFLTALGRSATPVEQAALSEFISEQAKLYGGSEEDVRVWSDVAHVIFNMKEFVFLN